MLNRIIGGRIVWLFMDTPSDRHQRDVRVGNGDWWPFLDRSTRETLAAHPLPVMLEYGWERPEGKTRPEWRYRLLAAEEIPASTMAMVKS